MGVPAKRPCGAVEHKGKRWRACLGPAPHSGQDHEHAWSSWSRARCLSLPRETVWDGWRAWVVLPSGDVVRVGVQKGSRPIRIRYKPRGQNIGYHWLGIVWKDWKDLHGERVPKSAGIRGLLLDVGLIEPPEKASE